MLKFHKILLLTIHIGSLVWAEVPPPLGKDIDSPFEKTAPDQRQHKTDRQLDLKMPPSLHDPKTTQPTDYDKRRKDCEEAPEYPGEYKKPQSRFEQQHASIKQPPTLVDDQHKGEEYARDYHWDAPNYKQLGVGYTYDDPEIARHYGKYERLHSIDRSDDQRRDAQQKAGQWQNDDHRSVQYQTEHKHDLHADDQYRAQNQQANDKHDHQHQPYKSEHQNEAHKQVDHKKDTHDHQHPPHRSDLLHEELIDHKQDSHDHHQQPYKSDYQHEALKLVDHTHDLHSGDQHRMGYDDDLHYDHNKFDSHREAHKHEAPHREDHNKGLAYEKKITDDQNRTDHHHVDRKGEYQHDMQRDVPHQEVHKQPDRKQDLHSDDQYRMGYHQVEQKQNIYHEEFKLNGPHEKRKQETHHQEHSRSFPFEQKNTNDQYRGDHKEDHQNHALHQGKHQPDHAFKSYEANQGRPNFSHDRYSGIKEQKRFDPHSKNEHNQRDQSRSLVPKSEEYSRDRYSDLEKHKQLEQNSKNNYDQHDQSRSHEPKQGPYQLDHYVDRIQPKQLDTHSNYEHNHRDPSRFTGTEGKPGMQAHKNGPQTPSKSQSNERYRISKPQGLPPLRSYLHTPDDPSTRAEFSGGLFTPAGSDPYNNRFATFTNAPYSVFHTQLNLDSPGNQFNVANTFPSSAAASREDAVRVPAGADGSKAIDAALKVNYANEFRGKPIALDGYHYDRPSLNF